MSNFITNYADNVTGWNAAHMNAPLIALDKVVSYHHNPIVHSDGILAYAKATGVLSWAGTLRVFFNASNGKLIQNTIAAGNITLADNEFAYVDLNETDGTVLTVSKAAITTNAASNIITVSRLVLAYRNATSDELFCVALKQAFQNGGGSGHVIQDAGSNETARANLNLLGFLVVDDAGNDATKVTAKNSIIVAASDETTDLAVSDATVTFRMPYAFTLTEVRASVNTAPTGANLVVDINKNGTTIFSTLLSIDAGEKTSVTATTAAVISTATFADDDEITIDITQVGSTIAGKGLKIAMIGY